MPRMKEATKLPQDEGMQTMHCIGPGMAWLLPIKCIEAGAVVPGARARPVEGKMLANFIR